MASFNPLAPRSDLTLWTGGWDSTFRVLQRAFVEEILRPAYLVERVRPSAGKELDTMNGLRKMLEGKHRELAARIQLDGGTLSGRPTFVPDVLEGLRLVFGMPPSRSRI